MLDGISHMAIEIWVFAALAVMVILFLIRGMASIYRKAGPHEALIVYGDRKSTRLNSSHLKLSRMPSSA